MLLSKEEIERLEDELERTDILISAAEKWAPQYSKDPQSHAKVIKLEAQIAKDMRRYFRTLANDRVFKHINWMQYHSENIKAYDVNVIFDEDSFDSDEVDYMMNVLYDPLLAGMGVGLAGGEAIYQHQIGLTQSSAAVQKAARDYTAKLVKGVNQTTKNNISQAIQTSLSLHEDTQAAADRITSVVNDPKRAMTIARTESVNSYSKGLLMFGNESGAVAKVWQALAATDECADLDGEKVAIDDTFSSGDDSPPLHPNCRCGMQLIYNTGDSSDTSSGDDSEDL